jgi:hypothetical protein
MRSAVASAVILVLLSAVALCPLIACSQAAPSCCHKPAKTVPDCPYSILEKSKTTSTATHAKWVGSIVRTEHGATLPVASFTIHAASRLVDAAGLFLRNRVLLI